MPESRLDETATDLCLDTDMVKKKADEAETVENDPDVEAPPVQPSIGTG